MNVSVCIASRGRHAMLRSAIEKTLSNAIDNTTAVSVALDDDDSLWAPYDDNRVKVRTYRREDSLGAKFNLCARQHDADVYVLWSDDQFISTPGWDRIIADTAAMFEDGLGVIYFGKIPGVLQPGIAVTREFIDAMGYFCVPHFPFWWHDTWIDEIARMTGRIVYVDVDCELLLELKGGSRGVREIEFWARFFDETRPLRRAIADRIITAGDDKLWRKLQLRQQMPGLEKLLAHRNSRLRDPAGAKQAEAFYGFDAPADERYVRIRAKAQAMLDQLAGTKAAA